jgi:hypothetical protein
MAQEEEDALLGSLALLLILVVFAKERTPSLTQQKHT